MLRDFPLPVFQRAIRLLTLLVLPALLTLPACKYDSADVEWTIPARGDNEVKSRSIIAVRLTNIMTVSDAENTAPGMITVTGDQTSGEYSGTIVAANGQDVFAGQTISEFQAGASQIPVLDPENPTEVAEELGDDTLVFLLSSEAEFKPGERITVTVSEDVTVLNVPFSSPYVFSFTVEGGGARSEGDLYVKETSPPQAAGAADRRPPVTAVLSDSILAGSENDAVFARGSQSGSHSGGVVQVEENQGEPRLTYVLAATDSFIPGEEVSVAFTSKISTGDGPEGQALSPYQLTFQVRPGGNSLESWEENRLEENAASSKIVAMLAADFLPGAGSVELVTFSENQAVLLNDTGRRVTTDSDDGSTFLDAVAVDADGDGSVELVALLIDEENKSADNESPGNKLRVRKYHVDGFGQLAASDSSLEFSTLSENSEDNRLYVADLDSDGTPELVAIHGEGTYDEGALPEIVDPAIAALLESIEEDVPEGELPSTGYLTIFELDSSGDSLQFVPVRNPISGFERSRKLQLVDLDNDGRLDLVSESASGSLVLYRNQTTSASPFSFRMAGELQDADRGEYTPDAWIVFDIDTDGDSDVLSWKDDVPLLHLNSHALPEINESLPAPVRLVLERLESEARGLLFDFGFPPPDLLTAIPGTGAYILTPDLAGAVAHRGDVLRASNIDGDPGGSAELVIAAAGGSGAGSLKLVRRDTENPAAFETFTIAPTNRPLGLEVSALSLLDFNGDTGLDVAVVFDDVPLVYVTDVTAENAVTPPDLSAYSMRAVFVDEGLDDLSDLLAGDRFGVEVTGDLKVDFSAYSIALDYDLDKLDFDSFEEPPGFETANFDPCPADSQDANCSGLATVAMTYQQDVTGVPVPGVPVKLGTFWFTRKEVQAQAQTAISFFASTNGLGQISNSLTMVEDVGEGLTVSQPAPVDTGDALEFEVNPRPPHPLVISCEGHRDPVEPVTEVLILWSTERAGVSYDCVKIEVKKTGETFDTYYEPWGRGSFFINLSDEEFLPDGDTSVEVTIHVTAGTGACMEDDFTEAQYEDGEVKATCMTVIGFPIPENVTCVSSGSGNNREEEVSWDWNSAITPTGFTVYINGVVAQFVGPDVREFEDTDPDSDGAILYEVSARFDAGEESERAGCRGFDDDCDTTEAPDAFLVDEAGRNPLPAPLAVEWDWSNREAYNSLEVTLSFQEASGGDFTELFGRTYVDLASANMERFVWPDDGRVSNPDSIRPGTSGYLFQGGAAPGKYVLSLVADGTCDVNGQNLAEVVVEEFTLEEPSLSEIDLSCEIADGDIHVNWTPPWRGYLGGEGYSMELQLLHEGDVQATKSVLVSDTEWVFEAVYPPSGSYSARMVLSNTAGDQVDPDESQAVIFRPSVSVLDSVFPPLVNENEISIMASDVIGLVSEVEFDLAIPAALTIVSINGVAINSPGEIEGNFKRYSFAPVPLSPSPRYLDGSATRILDIQVSGELPASSVTAYSVELENVKLKFLGEGDPVVITNESSMHGVITVGRSALVVRIDAAEPDPQDSDPRPVYDATVRGTLRGPDVAEGVLDYSFNAFTVHLSFNHEHLELLPIPGQEGTIVWPEDGEGQAQEIGTSILPTTPEALEAANASGDFRFGWIGINFSNPTEMQTIEPFENQDILRLRFRSLVPVTDPTTPSTISFVDDVDDGPDVEQPTMFFPEEIIPGYTVIDSFVDGQVVLGGNDAPLSVDSLHPATGPFDGGNHVRLTGANLGDVAPTIRLIPKLDGTDSLLVTAINSFSHTGVSFQVPALIGAGGTFLNTDVNCDVELEAAGQTILFENAYTYEAPGLDGVDTDTVKACDVIHVTGKGISSRTVVRLVHNATDTSSPLWHYNFDGLPAAAQDGRSINVQVPSLENLPSQWGVDLQLRLEVEFTPGESGGESSEYRILPTSLQFLALAGSCSELPANPPEGLVLFIRGDISNDGSVNVADGIQLLDFLFGEGQAIDCMDAADFNDDGTLSLTDSTFLLNFLFNNGPDIPAPHPDAGSDPTADALDCESGHSP